MSSTLRRAASMVGAAALGVAVLTAAGVSTGDGGSLSK
jgi:hypothetical protein